MESFLELGIIIAAVALSAGFIVIGVLKIVKNKQPGCSCCSGSGKTAKKTGKSCPHCATAEKI